MHGWVAAGLLLPPLGLYAASCFGEVRGLHEWLVPNGVWRTSRPHRVLTFDDGPCPERTPRLLDTLAQWDVKAIFFVVGEAARNQAALVRRMAAEGHVVGNHSWSHDW